jgi:hypothetical protein
MVLTVSMFVNLKLHSLIEINFFKKLLTCRCERKTNLHWKLIFPLSLVLLDKWIPLWRDHPNLSVILYIKVTRHYIFWHFFFNSFIFHCNSFGIYRENIFVSVYRFIQWGNSLLVKFISIYWQKNSVSIFICICYFFW